MIELLSMLLIIIIAFLVDFAIGQWLEFDVEKNISPPLFFAIFFTVVYYSESSFPIDIEMSLYLFFLVVGFLVFVRVVFWIFKPPTKKFPVKKKRLLIIPILILMAALFSVKWKTDRNQNYWSNRIKVARTKSEIWSLAVALETYYIDNKAYPPAVDVSGKPIPFSTENIPVSSGYLPWMLTTPVQYNISIGFDPFHEKDAVGWERTYHYTTNGTSCWILASRGPDQTEDMSLATYIRDASCNIENYLIQYGGAAIEYDPTNGHISTGDVFRTGP